MTRPYAIDPAAFYDDATLHKELRIRFASLTRARESGELKYTRRGGRIMYLGRWVLDWLTGEPIEQREPARAGVA